MRGAKCKGQCGLKGLRLLCLGLASRTNSGLAGCPVWKRLQAGCLVPLVSLSWFPLQQLRPISASWDWTKGWGGDTGASVPAQAFRAHGLSALALCVVGPGPWRVLARSHLALSHLAELHRSALSSVLRGAKPTELLQQATCQDLLVTASWAPADWLPVPGPCCSRSGGGTSRMSMAQAGWLRRPRLLEKRVAVERAVHLI